MSKRDLEKKWDYILTFFKKIKPFLDDPDNYLVVIDEARTEESAAIYFDEERRHIFLSDSYGRQELFRFEEDYGELLPLPLKEILEYLKKTYIVYKLTPISVLRRNYEKR